MINAIATLIGGAFGLYTLATLFAKAANDNIFGGSEFGVLTVIVALSMLTIVVGFVVRLACLTLLVFATRGTIALDWCRPNECVGINSWLLCSWNFMGRNGRQEGLRVCGLGIALQGDHDKSIINALAPSA